MLRLAAALAAAACAFVTPASAEPVVQTCDADDYRVAYVEVGGIEVAEVCTDHNPFPAISCTHPVTSLVCRLIPDAVG